MADRPPTSRPAQGWRLDFWGGISHAQADAELRSSPGLLPLAGTVASAAGDAALPERFQKWLEEVALSSAPPSGKPSSLCTRTRAETLSSAAFWKARDPESGAPGHHARGGAVDPDLEAARRRCRSRSGVVLAARR